MDNDLRPLTALPALRDLRMQDRRTYRPRVKELPANVG
jgi:hypothetical protein